MNNRTGQDILYGMNVVREAVRSGRRNVTQQFVTTGETISVGPTTLSILWPSRDQIARMNPQPSSLGQLGQFNASSVLGASSPDLNDGSIVFALRYGSFDALFTGDADTRVESQWRDAIPTPLLRQLADAQGQALGVLEVLKYPHHGSKTAMTAEFLESLNPKLAVISVGKNSYGHPSEAAIATLATRGVQVKRTDREGDIEVVSDGKTWNYRVK